jgi:hypothetical protein
MTALAKNPTVLPVRGQSVSELYTYFARARELARRTPADAQAQSTCALFANRLLRAQASSAGEILFKVEAAEWIDQDPRQTLITICSDLLQIGSSPRLAEASV